MADEKKDHFCPRCGQKGIRAETAEAIEFHCPTGSHGVIWRDKKPAPEPAPETVEAEGQLNASEPASSLTGAEKPTPRALN